MYERQAYQNDAGDHVFWGGLAIGSTGGGKGLVEQHEAAAAAAGVEVRYGVGATGLLTEDGRVVGVAVVDADGNPASCGPSRSSSRPAASRRTPRCGASTSGEGWERAKVRGTPLNTGDMLRAALEVGAAPYGDWSTCHSVAWDAGAADEGDRELTNRLTRGGYPLGIVVNAEGQRFLDEGADFRNYTYAKYGKAILEQPGGVAYQLFDATTRPLLRTEEYDMPRRHPSSRPRPSRSWPRASASTGAAWRRPSLRVQRVDRRDGAVRRRRSRTVGERTPTRPRATGR